MVRRSIFILFIFVLNFVQQSFGQIFRKPSFTGMYIQWGYSRDWYSKSNIHFRHGSVYDFTLHNALASDQPDYQGFWKTPMDITIPQNNFRLGLYLNENRTSAIEFNFDHAKYVLQSGQNLKVTGQIFGRDINKDTIVDPNFIQFEHTDGANFCHINYVRIHPLFYRNQKLKASHILKAGAGVVIPRSQVTIFGKELNNRYHISGYVMSLETGFRYYPTRKFFLEAAVKSGFANFLNSLTVEGGSAKHHFWYFEAIGLLGYEFDFSKKKKAQ